jgi:hypothetical protein
VMHMMSLAASFCFSVSLKGDPFVILGRYIPLSAATLRYFLRLWLCDHA